MSPQKKRLLSAEAQSRLEPARNAFTLGCGALAAIGIFGASWYGIHLNTLDERHKFLKKQVPVIGNLAIASQNDKAVKVQTESTELGSVQTLSRMQEGWQTKRYARMYRATITLDYPSEESRDAVQPNGDNINKVEFTELDCKVDRETLAVSKCQIEEESTIYRDADNGGRWNRTGTDEDLRVLAAGVFADIGTLPQQEQ